MALYITYIRPIMEYADAVFNTNILKRQVEDVQRQTLLCCVNAYRLMSLQRLLSELGLDPLVSRRKCLSLCHMYKIANRLIPKYPAELLPQRSKIPIITYSFNQIIGSNHENLYVVKNTFFWRIVNEWNLVSVELRQSSFSRIFKNGLQKVTLKNKTNKLVCVFEQLFLSLSNS